jgi:prolyl-tRNA synthetase
MLDVYAEFAENHLAIPVIKGEKTAGERFPGAENTYAIEAMMQDGKALQAGTSHFLGQNFSKANEIKFQGADQQERFAWTTSWGVSTRMIGAVIMAHSDDDGLVLPPSIAPNQVIIIPIARDPPDVALVNEHCQKLAKKLRAARYLDEPIRAQVDISGKRGGDKFWDAVKKGIPLRIEIGKREIEAGTLTVYRRDQAPKQRETIAEDAFVQRAPELLKEIHAALFAKALTFRDSRTREISSADELTKLFGADENALGTFALAYFDVTAENQPEVVERLKSLKLSVRCIPLSTERKPGRCIFTGNPTDVRVIFARAY